jgi:hypothetical protein
MRWLLAMCPMLAAGCLLPTNQISGSWNVGGEGGCIAGDRVNVTAPGNYDDQTLENYTCTDREFSVAVPADLHEFKVVFDVWPLTGRGVDLGTTVEVYRVIDDFNLGVVYFAPRQDW